MSADNKNASSVRRLTLELHEARARLDKVRALAEDTSESVNNDWGWGYDAAMESVLAILDGKDNQ